LTRPPPRGTLSPMLERLRDVPWDTLGTALGPPAPELAGALADVAARDQQQAIAALDAVRERVWREGAVFEVTPHVVPFLVELALSRDVLVRPPILQLLAFLHGGEGPTLTAMRSGDEEGRGVNIQARLTVERAWSEATRAAARRPLADYLSLLGDDDLDVRVAAACLVTVFRDHDAEVEVRQALTRRFSLEPEEVVRATVLGSLNVYLPGSHLEVYDLALEHDPSLLVRREAAHSIAAVDREETPRLAVAVLIEAILTAAELEPLYAAVAWNRRGVVADSVWALTRLGRAGLGLMKYFAKILERVPPRDALHVAEAALLVAFEGPGSSRSLADLGPEQVQLLRALVEVDAIWGQELPRMLAHYGLPREQETLRAWLSRS
jgi:hypothetical protein